MFIITLFIIELRTGSILNIHLLEHINQIVVHTYNGITYSREHWWSIATCINMDETEKSTEWKEANFKQYEVIFTLYKA